MRCVLCLMAGLVVGFLASPREYVPVETAGGRSVNLLIQDGFTVYDPQGFKVDRFDE